MNANNPCNTPSPSYPPLLSWLWWWAIVTCYLYKVFDHFSSLSCSSLSCPSPLPIFPAPLPYPSSPPQISSLVTMQLVAQVGNACDLDNPRYKACLSMPCCLCAYVWVCAHVHMCECVCMCICVCVQVCECFSAPFKLAKNSSLLEIFACMHAFIYTLALSLASCLIRCSA